MRAKLEFNADDGNAFTSVEFTAETHDYAHVSLMLETCLIPALNVSWGSLFAYMMQEEIENGSEYQVISQLNVPSIEGWIFRLQEELDRRKAATSSNRKAK